MTGVGRVGKKTDVAAQRVPVGTAGPPTRVAQRAEQLGSEHVGVEAEGARNL